MSGSATARPLVSSWQTPERHLAWPEPLTVEEIEASLMVGWARKVQAAEEKQS